MALPWNTPRGESNIITTDMNSLGAGSRTNAGTEVNNETNLDTHADFMLTCTFGTAPTAGTVMVLYLVYSVDGTNYEDGSSSVAPRTTSRVGVFPVRAVTTVQRIALTGVRIFPHKFKPIIENDADQALAASPGTAHSLAIDQYVVNTT